MSASTGDAQAATEWRAALDRVSALVREADPETLARPVPATPDWTALDLLAHMVGLGADVLAGDEADDHNPEWTQAHVDARADRSAEQTLTEWAALADDLEGYLRERDPRPLGDVIIHEQDLRGALGVPGARDTAGLAMIRAAMADRLGAGLCEAGLAPLALETDAVTDGVTDDERWHWQSEEGEPAVVLTGSGFELFRAVTSRRTEAQLRGLVVHGDLDPYLEHFAGLGALPSSPLPE